MRRWGLSLLLIGMSVTLIAAPAAAVADCNNTSTGLVPLIDLGADTYLGEQGGLYPGGSNEMPGEHLDLGLRLAKEVAPRAPDGSYSEDGAIYAIAIGVSNTMAQFNGLQQVMDERGNTNPDLVLANTAQVGRALGQWAQQNSNQTWNRAEQRVRELGGTPEQVQVGWMMIPPRTRGPRTLDDARSDLTQLTQVVQTAKERFPNLTLLYVSSRMYGGYVPDADSEPNAYNHGFEVKWLIEDQIDGSAALNADPAVGPVVAPWLAWGPYLWADGLNPRSDGLIWECSDYAVDGVHPHPDRGAVKVGALLYDHFMTDPTAAGWFPSDAAGQVPDLPATSTTENATAVTETSAAGASGETPAATRPTNDNRDADRAATTTDRVRRSDVEATAAAPGESEGWPPAALIGAGLGGLALGAVAGAAATRIWMDRKSAA